MHYSSRPSSRRPKGHWLWSLLPLVCAAAALGLWPLSNAAAATTVVVRPSALNGWALSQESPPQPTGSGSFVSGPATPPLGGGSAQFTVDSSGVN